MNEDKLNKKIVRYCSLKDAFGRLKELLDENIENENDIIRKGIMDGVIQRFEFTFELMWKVLKDYFEIMGFSEFGNGPRSVLKFAFKNGMLYDELIYSDMLEDRNSTTHLYDEKLANEIYINIKERYVTAIEKVIEYLEKEEYLK